MNTGTQNKPIFKVTFKTKLETEFTLKQINTTFHSASAFTLESQANWLNSTPGFQIIVEGHCDERGTREYNLALGERRANSVKEFLVSLGVDRWKNNYN